MKRRSWLMIPTVLGTVLAGTSAAAAQPAWEVQHLAKQRIPRAAYGCVREVKGSGGVLIALTNPHYRRAARKVLRETGTQGWVVTVPARLSEPGLRLVGAGIQAHFPAVIWPRGETDYPAGWFNNISWGLPNTPSALTHPTCGPLALSYDSRASEETVERLRLYRHRYGADRIVLNRLVGQ